MARRSIATEQRAEQSTKLPIKTAVTLSADAHRRLQTAVLVDGRGQSEIVENLITSHLVGYYAGRRGQTAAAENGEDE